MKDTKVVFFDIDGTIYLYGEGVPEDTLEAIRQLRKNGHIAVLCTGRTTAMIFPEITDIGFDGIIAGAGTYAEYKGKELYRYILQEDIAKEVIKTMRECGIMAIPEGIEHIYFDSDMMPEEYIPVYQLYEKLVGDNVINIKDADGIVVSKVSGTANKNAEPEILKQKFGDRFTFVEHQQKYIEMIPEGYSKAVGIERLIKHLDIPLENTYAFGDSMNDYEMLKYVKYGVAMGNATEEFKSQMDYVTEEYNRGGIRNALSRFGLI